eukprot:TRINITY_DN15169_c0_g1_i5.p1 TRINITY_DN15169_c0_g1~~TRINITY_DN15169_c0_g1_i5.p1  ORF type:complete len:360 (+),score=62.67 TRINITY_DN15169_c0_g1_i5:35-1114(+)
MSSPAKVLIDCEKLGHIQLTDTTYDADGAGIGNSASARRLAKISRPLAPGERLDQQVPISRTEEVLTGIVWMVLFGSVLWFPLMLALSLLFLPLSWSVTGAVSICVAVRLALPRGLWPPCRLPARMRLLLYRYFSLKIVGPPAGAWSTDTQYIFAGAPHGVIPFGDLLSVMSAPIGHINGVGASAVLNLPVFGDLLGCMGVVDCRKANLVRCLTKGRSLGVMPGGIAEIFENSSEVEVAYIANRKGFCKLALETGASLVPCYTLGNTDLFHCLTHKWLQVLSNTLRCSLTLFWGRCFLPIPFRKPVCFLLGSPIHVEKVASPTDEQVEELHKRFLKEMRLLFETHKADFGWKHKQLRFV